MSRDPEGLSTGRIAGLAWPRSRAGRGAAALGVAAFPFLVPDPPLLPGIVFAGESPYNTVFVEEQGGNRLLRLNDPRRGFHSVQLGRGMLTGAYYDVLYLAPMLARGRDVLVLGMGAGTTVRAYRRFYPGARVTAVEIDPLIVRVAREYMGLEPGPDLEVHVEDARPFLKRDGKPFDVIEVDLFAGGEPPGARGEEKKAEPAKPLLIVLNVVNTRAAQAEYMITHPTVQTVMFTGSVGIGRRVMELAARNLTHIVLELGGKDPMVVLDDADLDLAARGAVWAAFMNTGQSCASIERVYVDEKVVAPFTAKVLEMTESLRVGNPLDPDIDVGPMTTKEQRDVVDGVLRKGAERARLVASRTLLEARKAVGLGAKR